MTVLVTGGGGFLGSAIVRQLRRRDVDVRSLSRRRYSELDELGVSQIQGDIAEETVVARAVEGCDLVYHVAAKPGIWGPYHDYYRANVIGTERVIAACRAAGIRRLVFTSSPSVVFGGVDQENVTEDAPYPDRYLAHYPATKALAEQRVRAANDAELATVSLRPHLIWGPGDNHLVPRIIDRGRAGKLAIVGDESKLVDSVYIDNAAAAHLLAAERLAPGCAIAGKVYFITNGEPVPMARLLNGILAAAGLPPVKKRVPAGVAYFVGSLMEAIYGMLRLQREPRLTRFVARQLATAHWFDISAARSELDYQPKVTLEEGFKRLKQEFDNTNK